jgi:hypothetical protein
MGKHIPYKRTKNYAKHRCQKTIVKFDKNEINNEFGAIVTVEEHLDQSEGSWTASWDNCNNELTVYSKDTEILAYVAMLSI